MIKEQQKKYIDELTEEINEISRKIRHLEKLNDSSISVNVVDKVRNLNNSISKSLNNMVDKKDVYSQKRKINASKEHSDSIVLNSKIKFLMPKQNLPKNISSNESIEFKKEKDDFLNFSPSEDYTKELNKEDLENVNSEIMNFEISDDDVDRINKSCEENKDLDLYDSNVYNELKKTESLLGEIDKELKEEAGDFRLKLFKIEENYDLLAKNIDEIANFADKLSKNEKINKLRKTIVNNKQDLFNNGDKIIDNLNSFDDYVVNLKHFKKRIEEKMVDAKSLFKKQKELVEEEHKKVLAFKKDVEKDIKKKLNDYNKKVAKFFEEKAIITNKLKEEKHALDEKSKKIDELYKAKSLAASELCEEHNEKLKLYENDIKKKEIEIENFKSDLKKVKEDLILAAKSLEEKFKNTDTDRNNNIEILQEKISKINNLKEGIMPSLKELQDKINLIEKKEVQIKKLYDYNNSKIEEKKDEIISYFNKKENFWSEKKEEVNSALKDISKRERDLQSQEKKIINRLRYLEHAENELNAVEDELNKEYDGIFDVTKDIAQNSDIISKEIEEMSKIDDLKESFPKVKNAYESMLNKILDLEKKAISKYVKSQKSEQNSLDYENKLKKKEEEIESFKSELNEMKMNLFQDSKKLEEKFNQAQANRDEILSKTEDKILALENVKNDIKPYLDKINENVVLLKEKEEEMQNAFAKNEKLLEEKSKDIAYIYDKNKKDIVDDAKRREAEIQDLFDKNNKLLEEKSKDIVYIYDKNNKLLEEKSKDIAYIYDKNKKYINEEMKKRDKEIQDAFNKKNKILDAREKKIEEEYETLKNNQDMLALKTKDIAKTLDSLETMESYLRVVKQNLDPKYGSVFDLQFDFGKQANDIEEELDNLENIKGLDKSLVNVKKLYKEILYKFKNMERNLISQYMYIKNKEDKTLEHNQKLEELEKKIEFKIGNINLLDEKLKKEKQAFEKLKQEGIFNLVKNDQISFRIDNDESNPDFEEENKLKLVIERIRLLLSKNEVEQASQLLEDVQKEYDNIDNLKNQTLGYELMELETDIKLSKL